LAPFSNCIEVPSNEAVLAQTERRLKLRLTVGQLLPASDPAALLPMIRRLVSSHGEYVSQSAQEEFETSVLRYLSTEAFEFASGNWKGEYISGTFAVVIYRPRSGTVLVLRTGFYS
jgi:hypothetical protein